MESIINELEWCPSTETLEDILKNPKVKLPQFIKLSSELIFPESKVSITGGQIINVLGIKTLSCINGIDSSGTCISLSMSCPYTVQMKVPENEQKQKFTSLLDIANSDPLPKFVEIINYDGTKEYCTVGDVLKVVIVEKSGNIPSFIHFKNSLGTHFKIDIDRNVSFQLASSFPLDTPISTLLEKCIEFPIFIQFSPVKNTPNQFLEHGTIKLDSGNVFTIDFVIASADISSVEYVIIFPLSLDIKFDINDKMKLANDKSYRDLCCKFSNVSIECVETYLDQIIFYQDCHKIIIKKKKLQKQLSTKGVAKKVINGSKLNEIQGTIGTDNKAKQLEIQIDNTKVMKQKSNEVRKKSKKKKDKTKIEKGAEIVKENVSEDLYLIPEPRANNLSQSESTDKQWASMIKKKVKKVCSRRVALGQKPKINKTRGRKSECDVASFNESVCTENFYCELPYESVEMYHSIDEMDMKKNSVSIIPPPLPGNHPHQEKINSVISEDVYLDAVDTKNCMDLYTMNRKDITQNSLEDISTWGIEDISHCLKNLQLGKYKEIFEDSLVDGKLLLDLDESVLKDLGLNLFEACKLRKFVFGWRPGNMRPKLYPSLRGFKSDDPLDWDIEDAASHMTSIDIPEMAVFCRKNQVDGELLKDLCIDEHIMNSIITCQDRKLKIVKIRNYVIDQWRPKKKSTESSSEIGIKHLSHENEKHCNVTKTRLSDKTCETAEEKKAHFDAPRIARVKLQLEKRASIWDDRKKAL